MTTYLISYDLNQPGQDYKNLIDAIKSYPGYCLALKSQWFIETNDEETADTIFNNLSKHIDNNDLLFVCRVIKNLHGRFSKDCCEWLKQRNL